MRWMRGGKSLRQLNHCDCQPVRLVGYGTPAMAGFVLSVPTALVLQLYRLFLAVSNSCDDFDKPINQCRHCHLEFGSMECYEQHIQSTAESSGDAVYTCTICRFSSRERSAAMSHIRSHSKTKLYHVFGHDQKKEQQTIVKQLTEMSSVGTSVCMSKQNMKKQ